MSNESKVRAFTGRARRKQTPWTVRAADSAAKWLITVGGIGTIVAVSLVFLYLFAVAVPLFLPARIKGARQIPAPAAESLPLAEGVDDFRTILWTVTSEGELRVSRLDTGETLTSQQLLESVKATAVSQPGANGDVAVGAADGTVRFGTLGFATTILPAGEGPPIDAAKVAAGERFTHELGVIEKISQGQWRQQKFSMALGNAANIANSTLTHLDLLTTNRQEGLGSKAYLVAYATDQGMCGICQIEERENQFSGEKELNVRSYDLPIRRPADAELLRLLVTRQGDNVYIAWTNGLLQRIDIRQLDRAHVVEEIHVLGPGGARLTDCRFLIGRETVIVADSHGGLRAWFRTRNKNDVAGDGQRLTMVHDLTRGTAAVTAVAPSARGRSVVAGYEDGHVRVFHVTTQRLVLETRISDSEPVRSVAFAPREDGLVAATDRNVWTVDYDPRHPEVTVASLFRPVWYEGYDRPQHIWQSSFATSAPEMKLGLTPLVFGTIKATFYTMLFAAPLALLAAIFTSEFMHPRMRSLIKPTIEMMASLPSVVLGFLAALVFAPVIEKHIVAAVTLVYVAPFLYLLGAHLWQALPRRLFLRWQKLRIALLFLPLPLGIFAGLALEPYVERWLFAGNIMRWLDRQIGGGLGAWLLLWLPLSALLIAVLVTTRVNPLLRGITERCSHGQYVLLSLTKFLVASLLTVALAWTIAWLLDAVGWDPRGSYVSTYDQRNAFVVGVMLGFAVIPIIYTLADDALNTVPQHLRSASLACGATPWQTAIRVVVPTAMSGLFSALMIGLGRAVGETMIVLMAGGLTPVMEWNVFNGFRTLSANIATELPEAVRDSTHYRTLFLAALTLFLLTFCVNTLAELVRLRFRRRAFQL